MDKSLDAALDGVCDNCGYIGMADSICPECGRTLISLADEKPAKPSEKTEETADSEDDGRYDPKEMETVSLHDLEEDELAEDEDETL